MQVGTSTEKVISKNGFGCETGEPPRSTPACVTSDPTRVAAVCERWAACAAPAPRELSDLHGTGSSPTALSRPSCTGASMRVARLRPAPYAEYWSRLPVRHLPILRLSAYAVLSPLLPSNSLHAPGGVMLEMLDHSSNQFSARHTGPGCLRGPPTHPKSISLRDSNSSLPFPLPPPHSEGRC